MKTASKTITGRQVFIVTAAGFGVVIAVNLVLAYQAVATFPGLEVRNSYVASQTFDEDRAAQEALGWQVAARVDAGHLRLSFRDGERAVQPRIVSAVLGRATHVAQDQTPTLVFDGQDFVAPVDLAAGNWNLRLKAEAPDGTRFTQRVIVQVAR